ncbi:MAG TPA: hypothetical protein VMT27_09315 [Actinomycetes bacterium]|nr:hypothetical protein [Actinomycetes bacterium]
MDHVKRLLMAAIDERSGYPVGSDQLIQMALNALLDGVDTPALRQLAGLSRTEEPEAHDLFEQVIHELGLAPSLPDHPMDARWELVRWWCQLIVSGNLLPEEGGQRIWTQWGELGSPDALQSLVGEVIQWEDWTEAYNVPRETFREGIVTAARQLLEQPWPPIEAPHRTHG